MDEDAEWLKLSESFKPSHGQSMSNAWADFLTRYHWDWFGSLTFDPKRSSRYHDRPQDFRQIPQSLVHPEAAYKAFKLFVSKLNRSLYGPRWAKKNKGVYWVLAFEKHKSGILHMHFLMGDVENLNNQARRLTWMDEWFKLFGISRIEVPDIQEAVNRYCSKYVTKDGEIELSANLTSYARQVGLQAVA